jgi:hypothetical protein
MALVLKDRVKETTSTAGTSNFVLGGASSGYQAFSVVGNGNTTYYAAFDSATGDWEVGIGTYSTTGPTLTRDTVLESNNAGSKVVFAAGPKDVFLTYPAERAVYLDAAGSAVSILDIGTLGVSTANISTANITSGTVSTTPTNSTDIANKTYVDTLVSSGITYHTPVKYEVPDTTGNLNATYNNGTSGVGATLTNAGALAAFTPDGTVASVSDRILVYSQTNQAQNGVYVVTTVGSGSVAWVLTRASDANTYALKSPNGLGEGDAFFITSGNSGAGETYVCNTVGVITFGTTAITFAQISSAQIYSAGTGLTLTDTQFSITNTAVTANTYGSGSSVPVFSVNAQGQITSATPTAIAIAVAAVSGLAASATTDTTNASNITSGTLGTLRLSGSYTGITGVGTLAAGTWNGTAIATIYGGTGQTSYAVGDLVYADTTTTIAKLSDVAVGNALISGGVNSAPSYGKIGLATHVSGILPVANGGTGATDAAGIRTAAGATTVGGNLFTLTNPSAITFPQFNANNTVSALDAASFRTAIGAGTGSGTVTSVTGTAPVVSSGGTAPAISMAAASSGVNGYMTGVYATKLDGIATGATNVTDTNQLTNGAGFITSSGSISGNAATATSSPLLSALGNYVWSASTLPTSYSGGIQSSFVSSVEGFQSYGSVMTMRTYASGGGSLQMYVPYSPTYGGTGMQVRFGNYDVSGGNSWTSWKTLLASDNYTSYAPSLTGSGASGTWGINVTGNAATATNAQTWNFTTTGNPGWGAKVQIGGNGGASGVATIAVVQATDGNLHIDSGLGKSMYLNYYQNGIIYLNGTAYSISSNGSYYNGTAAAATTTNNLTNAGTGIYASSSGTSYASVVCVREAGLGGSGASPPKLGFHWGGVVASSIGVEASGRMAIFNNPGTSYEALVCASLYATGNITAYSDETLKKNWRDLPTDFVSRLAEVKHGVYDRIDQEITQVGVSAQSLQTLMPNAVIAEENGKLSVAYGNAALVSAVQLAKRVVEQDARIAKLEAIVAKLTEGN